MSFEDAMCNCERSLEQPSFVHLNNPVMLDSRDGELFTAIDHNVEKTKRGLKVTQVNYPLMPMPTDPKEYSCRSFISSETGSQRAADLGK